MTIITATVVCAPWAFSDLNDYYPIYKGQPKGAIKEESKNKAFQYFWIDPLFGIVEPGITAGIKLNVEIYRGVFAAVEMMESVEMCILCWNSENLFQRNILVGKRLLGKYYYAYMLAGVGKITGEKKGRMEDDGSGSVMFQNPRYEDIEVNTYGIPIEFGVGLAKYIGIGANMHINLNKDYATAGFLVSVPLGFIN